MGDRPLRCKRDFGACHQHGGNTRSQVQIWAAVRRHPGRRIPGGCSELVRRRQHGDFVCLQRCREAALGAGHASQGGRRLDEPVLSSSFFIHDLSNMSERPGLHSVDRKQVAQWGGVDDRQDLRRRGARLDTPSIAVRGIVTSFAQPSRRTERSGRCPVPCDSHGPACKADSSGESTTIRAPRQRLAHPQSVRTTPGADPITHAAGGERSNVSTRIESKPATSSASTIWAAAAAVVSAVAPGHLGCETIATRPLSRSRPASIFSVAAGCDHIPMLLTAKILSNRRSKAGGSSMEATMSDTRPRRIAAALRRAAWARITADRSMPRTWPRDARFAISRMAIPGPNPISSTRSNVCMSMSDTAQMLRLRFEGRSAISQPTRRPGSPRGFMN